MSRKFDIVVYGASGYTGIYVVEEIIKYLDRYGKDLFRWAVAGRDESKLRSSLSTSAAYANVPWFNDSGTEIIQANANDRESLSKMTSQTHLLINCVGPFRQYGDPVVKSCIGKQTYIAIQVDTSPGGTLFAPYMSLFTSRVQRMMI